MTVANNEKCEWGIFNWVRTLRKEISFSALSFQLTFDVKSELFMDAKTEPCGFHDQKESHDQISVSYVIEKRFSSKLLLLEELIFPIQL
jgi:hypothetical protein